MRCKGFMMGGTAGRTTLAGEGLQHQDGQSLLLASAVPTLQIYDPAYAYEMAIIIRDGIRRMYEAGEDIFYYLTIFNENYAHPQMPEGAEEGILKGLYLFRPAAQIPNPRGRVQLLGSGPILRMVLQASEILRDRYQVMADVWSATSYNLLRRDCLETDRWNMLHPDQPKRQSYLSQVLANRPGPFVAASDFMKAVPDQIAKWVPGALLTLGTDGFGRSEDRASLRQHFEVDAEHVAVAALYALAEKGDVERKLVEQAIRDLEIDPDVVDPARA
jgi:pyruvate dehydrogenase E1 component